MRLRATHCEDESPDASPIFRSCLHLRLLRIQSACWVTIEAEDSPTDQSAYCRSEIKYGLSRNQRLLVIIFDLDIDDMYWFVIVAPTPHEV
jgi:hypothetical protein